MMTAEPLLYPAVALLGLVVGSFLNVVVYRIPIMMDREDADPPPLSRFDLAWPPSHCPSCARPIRPWENIPLVSYVALGGRCPGCRQPIALRYLVIESLAALTALGFLTIFGTTVAAAAATVFGWWALTIAAIDVRTMLIPDRLVLPLLWAGLLISVHRILVPPEQAILGATTGYALFWLIARVGERLAGRPVLGFGDVKLLAAIGAWLGVANLPDVLFAGSLIGSVWGGLLIMIGRQKRSDPLPFGPFLIAGALLAFCAHGLGLSYFPPRLL